MRTNRVAVLALAAFAFACKGDSGTGPPTYENIAGTYTGTLAGISQGITMQGTFTLTITQSGGSLEGSYSGVGTLSDGVTSVPVQGTGAVAGTIAGGTNPSVNLTVTWPCPNPVNVYSGAYDSVNHVITLNGTLSVFNASCQVVLSYPGTIIFLRG